MAYETCKDCDHTWHGLRCKAVDAFKKGEMLYVQVRCECPTSWREPNDDREPHDANGLAR